MKPRRSRLPIASLAVVVSCFLVGLALGPVGAQTQVVDGQVTVRSDGAVYLLANGMRRWVATVVISDEELNAYPEAEPIYAGLVPFGTAGATTASTGASGTGAAKVTGSPTTGSGTTTTGTTGTTTTTGSPGEVIADPASGADPKDPNDPTLAAAPPPSGAGQTAPSGGSCPDSHKIKGATTGSVKYYYDPERTEYASITPEMCFTAGADARAAGYTEIKKR